MEGTPGLDAETHESLVDCLPGACSERIGGCAAGDGLGLVPELGLHRAELGADLAQRVAVLFDAVAQPREALPSVGLCEGVRCVRRERGNEDARTRTRERE